MKIKFINKLSGMQIFTLVWFGQFVSLMGTSMTRFATLIWAYEQTGKALTTAMLGFSSFLPYILLLPVAGVVVDRYSRKKIMIISDAMSALATVGMIVLYSTGNLKVWYLFFVEAYLASLEPFQAPAYSAAMTMLIPKEKYDRAYGMRSFAHYATQVFTPILAGLIVVTLGLKAVLIIDIVTFFVAVCTTGLVNIPSPERKIKEQKEGIWSEFKYGIGYLLERKGLIGIMAIMLLVYFSASMTYNSILPAMILARTDTNKVILAGVTSALGLGGVAGSALTTAFGTPKKKVITMFAGMGLSYLLGDIFLGLGRSQTVWYVAAFLSSFLLPVARSAQNTLWQCKIEPQVQGRVFSMRDTLQMAAAPLGFVAGGLMADYVFEPGMAVGGSMEKAFGWMVGSGPGAGMALMFFLNGILGVLICASGIVLKDIRNLERDLPDFDAVAEEE